MSNTIYIVDTNIILRHPLFMNTLRDATVIIPSVVLEEIDSFKKDNELGKNARLFGNTMDTLFLNSYKIPDINVDIHITFREPNPEIIKQLGGDSPDNRIIESAHYFDNFMEEDIVLLSNDTLVRVKARGLGIESSKFTSDESGSNSDIIYTGNFEVDLSGSYFDTLYDQKYLDISEDLKENLNPHMFFKLNENSGERTALVKVNADITKMELLKDLKPIWGITALNIKQRMAFQLLLDPDIHLVTMLGKAGAGKTLLTLAAGLLMVTEESLYDKLVLTKPVVPMGKDIGYLPGNKEEKMTPWLQSYYDNLEQLCPNNKDYDQLKLEINVLTYIRGRSLPGQFIIVDECQNLSKHEIKTIVTRAGKDTKIILMGDIDQIDAPFLDSMNNGLSYVINKFKDQKIAGHITLDKSERSELASIAAEIL